MKCDFCDGYGKVRDIPMRELERLITPEEITRYDSPADIPSVPGRADEINCPKCHGLGVIHSSELRAALNKAGGE